MLLIDNETKIIIFSKRPILAGEVRGA